MLENSDRFEFMGFGALNYDRIYLVERIGREGEEIPIISKFESGGGSAANTIYALSLLGKRCAFLGAVGDDTEGKHMIDEFKKVGVDTKKISIKKTFTGFTLTIVDRNGERVIYPNPGANNELQHKDVDIDYLNRAEIVHITSFVGNTQFNIQKEIVKELKCTISFSPGNIYVRKGFSELLPIFKKSKIVFLNMMEVKMLFKEIEKVKKIIKSEHQIVVVTAGKKGAFAFTSSNRFFVPAFGGQVLDTTGAGDSFAAGFLYGFHEGFDIAESLRAGSLLASFSLREYGARKGLPDRKEFLKLLEGNV